MCAHSHTVVIALRCSNQLCQSGTVGRNTYTIIIHSTAKSERITMPEKRNYTSTLVVFMKKPVNIPFLPECPGSGCPIWRKQREREANQSFISRYDTYLGDKTGASIHDTSTKPESANSSSSTSDSSDNDGDNKEQEKRKKRKRFVNENKQTGEQKVAPVSHRVELQLVPSYSDDGDVIVYTAGKAASEENVATEEAEECEEGDVLKTSYKEKTGGAAATDFMKNKETPEKEDKYERGLASQLQDAESGDDKKTEDFKDEVKTETERVQRTGGGYMRQYEETSDVSEREVDEEIPEDVKQVVESDITSDERVNESRDRSDDNRKNIEKIPDNVELSYGAEIAANEACSGILTSDERKEPVCIALKANKKESRDESPESIAIAPSTSAEKIMRLLEFCEPDDSSKVESSLDDKNMPEKNEKQERLGLAEDSAVFEEPCIAQVAKKADSSARFTWAPGTHDADNAQLERDQEVEQLGGVKQKEDEAKAMLTDQKTSSREVPVSTDYLTSLIQELEDSEDFFSEQVENDKADENKEKGNDEDEKKQEKLKFAVSSLC